MSADNFDDNNQNDGNQNDGPNHGHGHEPCCFMAGTMLRTPDCEVAVENLQPGDLLCTLDGAAKPLLWLGRSTVSTRFADPLKVLPVRIRAGALGPGRPDRDLLLSPDHALFFDGVLVQAAALINGVNITRAENVPEIFTYYHAELASHEVLFAEGVPVESFVDNVERTHFDNWQEREAIGGPRQIEEMPYPRAKSFRQLPVAIRERINARFETIAIQAA